MPTIHTAVIFDFDGTIIDTEWPDYSAFQRVHRDHGLPPIPLARWQSTIGLADNALSVDFTAELLAQRPGIDEGEIHLKRRRYRDSLIAAEQTRAGVKEWVDHASTNDLPLGVASSSSPEWVLGHLERIGLLSYFDHVEGTSHGQTGKPAPDVYLRCASALDANPLETVAIEDSPHGASAALAAGMSCIAVPNRITAGARFDPDAYHLSSLGDADPTDWLLTRERR
ncbi:MAG: HAD-IA family hydrolase [Actinomycetia bacterium]|nr:HAD-IA family hydrolase [Actinomycetes bacterium]MCP4958341.1 HAD-IA family hydrolase [Actinomycetes bacterium]